MDSEGNKEEVDNPETVDEQVTVEMDRQSRRTVIVMLPTLLVAVMVIFPVLAITRDRQFSTSDILAFMASAGIIMSVLLYMAYELRKTGWMGVRFVATSSSLTRIMPDGTSHEGKWKDLQYVSPAKGVLVFADGTTIALRIGLGMIESKQIEKIAKLSGDESLMCRAFKEYSDAALSPRRRMTAYLIGALIGVIFLVSGQIIRGAGTAVMWYLSVVVVWLMIPAAIVVLRWTVRKQVKVDRKYGPPRKWGL